jgi:hypothetical protein
MYQYTNWELYKIKSAPSPGTGSRSIVTEEKGRCRIRSRSDGESMPEVWSSDRSFHPMQFAVSHSRLVLRGFGDSMEDFIDVEFIGVDRMELSRVMPGGVVLRTVEAREGYRARVSSQALLQVEIEWSGGVGFVAAELMRVIRHFADGADPELVLVEPERAME